MALCSLQICQWQRGVGRDLELGGQPTNGFLYSLIFYAFQRTEEHMLFGLRRVRCSVWKYHSSMLSGLRVRCPVWKHYLFMIIGLLRARCSVCKQHLSCFSVFFVSSGHSAGMFLSSKVLAFVEAVVATRRCGDMELRVQPPNKLCIASYSLPSTHTSRALTFPVASSPLSVALLFLVDSPPLPVALLSWVATPW